MIYSQILIIVTQRFKQLLPLKSKKRSKISDIIFYYFVEIISLKSIMTFEILFVLG